MEHPYIYYFFNDDELLRISNKVREYEKNTAGEICISIREKRSFSDRKKDIRKLAEEEFFRRNIDKTRDKTGILIFLLLKEKRFYILADAGINEKVSPDTWDSIKEKMQKMFIEGRFAKGILAGVEEVGKILCAHFPVKPDDTNELSDNIVFN